LARGTVTILSTIRQHGTRNPFASEGFTGKRDKGASVVVSCRTGSLRDQAIRIRLSPKRIQEPRQVWGATRPAHGEL